MGVKTSAEILAAIKDAFGGEIPENAVALLEDISDTFSDYDRKIEESGNWEQKYKENDTAWRKKYSDRFFEDSPQSAGSTTSQEKPKTFDELFEEE